MNYHLARGWKRLSFPRVQTDGRVELLQYKALLVEKVGDLPWSKITGCITHNKLGIASWSFDVE